MEAVNLGCQGNKMATSFVSRASSFHILSCPFMSFHDLSWPFMTFHEFVNFLSVNFLSVRYTPRTSTFCVSKLQNDHIMQPYSLLSPAVNCWAH